MGERIASDVERSIEIDRHDAIKPLGTFFMAIRKVSDASNVADNVETTECLGGFVDNLLNIDCLGDIKVVGSGGAAGLLDFSSGLLGSSKIGQCELSTFGCETKCSRASDARSGASDKDALTLQALVCRRWFESGLLCWCFFGRCFFCCTHDAPP